MEEFIYALGHSLEALRLEIRASSCRHNDPHGDYTSQLEDMADAEAAIARPAYENPLNRKES